MPDKAQIYAQMADDTARKITGDYLDWATFLATSSRLYKYPFHDQLLIYAQRPDATACASYDLWNDTMRRYVRRGSKGIALLTPSASGMSLRYVFDVSDTGTRQNSRNVEPWALSDETEMPVRQMLEDQYYADASAGLIKQIDQIAQQQALAYWRDHARDIRDSVDSSALMDYDDFSIGASFRKAAAASISYSIQSRCGLEPELFREDFTEVLDWNTPATVAELGKAVSEISGQILRQIETTVRTAERSMNHERTELQEERRLSTAGHGPDRSGAQAPGQVRDHEAAVPGAEPARPVHPADPQRQADGASPGDRRDSAQQAGEPDEPADEAAGRDGGTESQGSDGLGRSDEQPQEPSRGNDPDGTDLRLTYTEPDSVQIGFEIPTEEEQIEAIERQAQEPVIPTIQPHAEAKPSAFSVSDEEIDHVLRRGSGFAGGRLRIAALYDSHPTPKEAQDFLKEEYGIGGHSHTYLDGTSGFVDYNSKGIRLTRGGFREEMRLRWPAVEQHIRRMVEEGTYLSADEKTHFDEMMRDMAGNEIPVPVPRAQFPPVSVESIQGETPAEEADSKYKLGFGHMGNGMTVWNSLAYENGDYKIVAHIAPDRTVTFYDDEMPESIRERIIREAETANPSISATQDAPVFSTPPREINPQLQEEEAPDATITNAEEAPLLASEQVDDEPITMPLPMEAAAEYNELKAQHPDALIGFEQHGNYEFYGEDAKAAALILNAKLLTKEIPGGQVEVTGFPAEHWQRYFRALWSNGNDVFLAGEQPDGTHEETKYLRKEDYIPLNAKLHISGREFRVESVDFQFRTVSLQDMTMLREANYPIFRQMSIAEVRNYLEDEIDFPLSFDTESQPVEDMEKDSLDAASIETQDTAAKEVSDQQDAIPPLRPGERLIPAHDGIPAMREVVIDLTSRNLEEPVSAQEATLLDAEVTPVFHTQNGTTYRVGDEFESKNSYGDIVRMKIERIEGGSVWLSTPARTPDNPYDIYQSVFEKYIDEGQFERVQPETPFEPTVQVESETSATFNPDITANNYRITDDHLGEGGQKTKFENNMRAIRTLKTLEKENRPASPEDQEVLSQYVGWGGIPQAFDERNTTWADEYRELKAALTPEEYEMARASTLNAHYTSPTVIRAIYSAVEQMGFRTGNILEPSCGVGNFFGLLPESMENSRLYGVELDSITGRIAQCLYPQANIEVTGFEKTDRKDFFDLAIGNVPFGAYKVSDRQFDRYNFLIHDYFFAKALDQVRPGGIVAFITSKGTMDKQSPEVRKYIAQRAELLGAIRLPNTAFKANAGTEVTSDIIFLQKRDRAIDIEPDWVHLGQTEDGVPVNSYFADHPDMILGKMVWDDSMYGAHQETACQPLEGADLAQQLAEAVTKISGTYREEELPELAEGEAIRDSIPADPNVRNYSYTVVDDKVYYRENSAMVHPDLNATAEARIKGMVALRDCVHRLMDAQLQESDDYTIHELQAELNTLYDSFTAKYGLINSRPNAQAFSDDSSYYLLSSLEILTENGELERKADMFTKRTIRQQHTVDHVDTAVESLAVSIAEKAAVDLPFMAELTGKSEDEIASDLTGVIFRLPAPVDDEGKPKYVTADEYLSGNVRQKLRDARAAADISPIFEPNVKALEKAQPKDLDASEIDVRLGATWVDKEYIQQFMNELFEVPLYQRRAVQVQYSNFTSEWRITGKTSLSYNNVANNLTYGTDRASGLRILEDTLNLRDVRIYDTIEDADGKEKRVLNQKATTLAQQKQQAIKDAFRDWVWKDPDRREALVKTYNELFNSIRPREYDGQHISFSGMNPEITLREHQRNAIAHTLYGGNTLLAHVVGAGKTYEMVASAMESKRLGLCSKSMFVVPNHLTEQWASEFLRLYPSAKILVTTKKDFEKNNRRRFCSRIATGDYDAIIIGHSQFEKIPMSKARQENLLQEQIEEITQGIQELKFMRGEQFSIKQMERTKKQLEGRLRKLQAEERKDDVVTFEELGVDRLFVDEAHSYKNLFLTTKMRNVAGLSTSEAQKSTDMFLKCRYMDELTGGRGIVFATGTPISNSMTEMYTMQRYLQYGTLRRNNMTHFDSWASTFGETTTAIELAPEGTGYRARTRFSKFFNLPELMTMFKEVADIKTADQLNLPTPTPHYETVVVQPTEIQKAMVQSLSERAGKVHSGSVDPRVDNMLKITSDGRKLGLDQRLINPLLPDDPSSKVNSCINNIFRIWQDGADDRLTQLVFCDISTPKGMERTAAQQAEQLEPSDAPKEEDEMPQLEPVDDLTELAGVSSNAVESNFNVYEDIRSKLIARGVPPEEIAFIHDANTEVKKKELFAKVRAGQVRVLIGSTAKMGAGTNCQDRLIALHDLDCPWRPGDLEQRSGRIIRQGNMNPDVQIYRYATEGTFDSYLWQTVENKQKFISQIMTSKSPVRSCEDIDEAALSYAEIKALCAGDPAIKEKMDLDVDVARLRLMKADHQSQQYRLEDRLLKYFPQEIERNKGYIRGFEQDQARVTAHPLPEKDFVGITILGKDYADKEKAGEAILAACKSVKNDQELGIGEYRGFLMYLMFNPIGNQYILTLKGEMSHPVELGADPRGNLTRIDNALAGIPRRQQNVENKLNDLKQQMATAKAELGKPFPQEEELRTKSARLAELDSRLNLDRPAVQAEKKKSEQER